MKRFALLWFSTFLFGAAEPSLHEHLSSSTPAEIFPSYNSDEMSGNALKNKDLCVISPSSCYPEFFGPDAGGDYYPQNLILNDTFPYRYRSLIEDTLYLQLVMLGTIGVLAIMPESVTNWNMADLQEKSLSQRWKDNVTRRPVWDNDDWTINYIGHPISGAWYYTLARNDGMSIGESVAFSAILSTFFWEYGYEAFAEVPSIQDLFVTPLVGSVFGEGMYVLEKKLDARGGQVWGSKVLGNIGYFLLNPLGNIAYGIKEMLRRMNIKRDVTISFHTYPKTLPLSSESFLSKEASVYGPKPAEYGFVIIIR